MGERCCARALERRRSGINKLHANFWPATRLRATINGRAHSCRRAGLAFDLLQPGPYHVFSGVQFLGTGLVSRSSAT